MIEITIDPNSAAEVGRHFVIKAEKMKAVTDIILKSSLLVVERFAKYYAPVKTGRLRASIGGGSFSGGSFSQGEGIAFGDKFASIGPTVNYALYVNRRIPFMAAAAQSSLADIDRIVKQQVQKALE